MKHFLTLKHLLGFLAFHLFVSFSNAQTLFRDASYVTPGYNSCRAVEVISDADPGYGGIYFPVPAGLTLGMLNNLATDYMATEGGIGGGSPRFVVHTTEGYLFFNIGHWPNEELPNTLNTWYNSGNLAAPTALVDASNYGGGNSELYGTFQAAHSNDVVTDIYIVLDAAWYYGTQIVRFDNSNVNGTLYNYEGTDTDGDGLVDSCDPDDDNDGTPDNVDCAPLDAKNDKYLVCHKGQTICVSNNALQGHLNHGDNVGPCPTVPTQANSADETMTLKPSDFQLSNYPNPFTNKTRIQYSIPVASKVNITVFDAMGRTVSTLVDAEKAAGVYSVDFDGTKVSKGIYYYRLTATSNGNQTIQTKNMTVIK